MGASILWSINKVAVALGFSKRTIIRSGPRPLVLDKTALIDGRILGICEEGFTEGELVVPQFVLRDLTQMAAAPHPLQQRRGERALQVLQDIRRVAEVRVTAEDFGGLVSMADRVLALAKHLDAALVTKDADLERVARVRGVRTLNPDRLAYALRPAILPGETLHLLVARQGRHDDQGIGFLDDGSPVIVNGGRVFIGQAIEVVIESIVPKLMGRLYFGRPVAAANAPTATA